MVLLAVAAPLVTPYDPNFVEVGARLQPPSAAHWLGTDTLGRDVLTRVIYGARISLSVGFTVVLLGALFGTLVGAIAAYAGRWAEEAMMRVTDLVLLLPADHPGHGDRRGARHRHGQHLHRHAGGLVAEIRPARPQPGSDQRNLEYVEAAQSIGFGPAHILLRQILPNAVGPLIVLVTLDLGNAILVFAGLSFLGLGAVPPTAEWGAMVAEGPQLVQQWWVATFPGLAILTVVHGLQLRRRRPARLAGSPCKKPLRCCCRCATCAPGS